VRSPLARPEEVDDLVASRREELRDQTAVAAPPERLLRLDLPHHRADTSTVSQKNITQPLDLYVRVSTVRGRQGDSFISPELQEEKCRALARARGLAVGQVFTDLDRSGDRMDRPAFKRVLARIEAGESGGVIVARIDRFARTLIGGLQAIESIEKAGGIVLTADGEFDTSTATGELVLRIMLSLAAFELRRIREGWADAQAKARARGVHIGVARAGYRRDENGALVEVPEHLDAVKQAFALRARGSSWQETAGVLTAAGVPTWRGKTTWTPQAAQSAITNRAYRAPAGPIPAWQWDKAQPNRDGARSPRGEGYVLGNGLVRCGHCGAGLVRTHSHGTPMLRCPSPGTGHAAISYDKAADFIVSLAFSHIGPMLKTRPGGDGEALRQAVSEARADIAAVEALLGTQAPPDSKQRLVLEQAEAALAEFEAKAQSPLGLADFVTPLGVRVEFEKLPAPEQRRVLRDVVSRVVLKPGKAHVGTRLALEFADGAHWPAEPTEVPA
jgi:DNA invertase Pin-like site-specific DNA recombinase